VDRIEAAPNISVRTTTSVVEAGGEQHLRWLVLRDEAGAQERVDAGALFVFIGMAPRTAWLDGLVERDEAGFLLTGHELGTAPRDWPLERLPLPLETSIPGVFAAGDVRVGSVKRVASAVGEGAMAVRFVHQHLASV